MGIFAIRPPALIARELGGRAQQLRILEGWSQQELARRSGVALGTLRRFEQSGAISLARLLMIAAVLRRLDDFGGLFEPPPFRTMAEMQEMERIKSRMPKRGRTLSHAGS
jgi:transcriptional regulator with XRE-family HTH domain